MPAPVVGALALSSAVCATLGLAACVPTIPTPDGGFVEATPEIRLGDCATAEQGLEFAPSMIVDFEALNGLATYMYTYTDNTSAITPSGYQPATEAGTHCTSDPGQRVFHFHSTPGPFLGWGGGLGVSMLHLNVGNGAATIPDSILDASQWDGVAVWARRGSNSQPLLRVLVGNKYTDDDISFLMYLNDPAQPRYCERVRECACINGLDCTFYDDTYPGVVTNGGTYCGTPGIVMGQDISTVASGQMATNTCNLTRCNDPYAAHPEVGGDPEFAGRQCRPFTYRTGVSSSFCYDPVGTTLPGGRAPDPSPAETDQQCGDHWTYPMHVTGDWQLFLVPFASMFQQGFAKRFPSFDLKSVSVVRLTWDAGPVDFYVDNWRFYRVARPN